jgi:invasion protein IalB
MTHCGFAQRLVIARPEVFRHVALPRLTGACHKAGKFMDQMEQRAIKQMTSNTNICTSSGVLRGSALAAAFGAMLGIATPGWAQQTPQDPNKPQVQLVEKSKHGDWSIRCPTIVQPKTDETGKDESGKGDLESDESTEDAAANPQTPDLSDRCVMMQGAPHSKQTDVQVFVTVKKNKIEGKVIGELHVNVPLYIVALLPKGIGIEIDGDTGNAKEVPFVACPPPPLGVCIAIQQLTDAILGELKKGSSTKIYLWQVNGQSHIFELSLKGFTKAYDEL